MKRFNVTVSEAFRTVIPSRHDTSLVDVVSLSLQIQLMPREINLSLVYQHFLENSSPDNEIESPLVEANVHQRRS